MTRIEEILMDLGLITVIAIPVYLIMDLIHARRVKRKESRLSIEDRLRVLETKLEIDIQQGKFRKGP